MNFQFTLFVIPLLLAVGVNAALGVYAWRRRSANGALPFVGMMLAITWWCLGYAFELSGIDLSTKLLWSNISYVGRVAAPTAWFTFALAYSSHQHQLTRRNLILLCIVPLFTLLLVFTNNWHYWFWSTTGMQDQGAYSTLQLGFGPAFYFHTAYSYLLILAGSVLILREQLGAPRLFWGQRLTLLLSMLFPWVANLFVVLRLPPWDALDPTPFAFTLTGLGLAWSLFGFRLLEVAPLARQDVIENLMDGLLVLDIEDRLVDFNQTAQRILQVPLHPWVGKPAEKLFAAWPELKSAVAHRVDHLEWSHATGSALQAFDVSLSPVYDALHKRVGRSIILHEVTRLKQAEADLKLRTMFLEALQQVIEVSNRVEDVSQLMSALLDQALAVLHIEQGCVWFREQRIQRGLDDQALGVLESMPLPGDMAAQGVMRVDDVVSLDQELTLPGVKALLWVPIQVADGLVGRFGLFSASPRAWSDEEVAWLRAVAQQLVLGCERLACSTDVHAYTSLISRLVSSMEALSHGMAEEEVLAAICQSARNLINADRVEVLPLVDNEETPEIAAVPGTASAPVQATRIPGVVLVSDVHQQLANLNDPQLAKSLDYQALGVWPLVYQEHTLAILRCYYDRPYHWSVVERDVMQAFTCQAAVAIESARLFTAHSRQSALGETLHELTARLSSSLDPADVLKLAFHNLDRLFVYDQANILSVYDDRVTLVHGHGFTGTELEKLEASLNQRDFREIPGIQSVCETLKPVLIRDTHSDANWLDFWKATRARSYLGVPVVWQGKLISLVNLFSQQPNQYHPQHVRNLEIVANQVAVAVHNAFLYASLQKQAEETMVLYRALSRLFNPGGDVRSVAEQVAHAIVQEFPDAYVAVLLADDAGKELNILSWMGYPMGFENHLWLDGPGITVVAYNNGETMYIPDVRQESRYISGAIQTRSELALPLRVRGRAIGVLNLEHPKVDAFDDGTRRVMGAFAEHAALALENARLFDEVQRLAVTDHLTGLYNRRGYAELGRREVERARRYQRPLAAIMLDIDHFKQVNDQYKHAVGDDVLRGLANRCLERIREIDILGRYGGEELVLLLPETDLDGGVLVAESLRQNIERNPFQTSVGDLWITISLGVAIYTGGEMDLETLLDRADDAMYSAKQAGRNLVKVFNPMITE